MRDLDITACSFLVLAGLIGCLSVSYPAPAIATAGEEVSVQPEANRPVADKWALIVGISQFADSSLNLKYPSKDARDFYDFLIKEEHFSPDHVRILTDGQATREHILDELGDKWLPRVAGRDDLVIIYISSHGSPSDMDVGGVNYIVAYDTDKNRLYSTGIAMQDMCRIIKARVHTDRAVLVLDACHSGAAVPEGKGLVRSGNVDVEEIVQGTGQLVISSSEPSQVSWESRSQQNSVFTRYLIDGLRANGTNTTLGDAYKYMRDRVEDEVRRDRGAVQTPVLKGKWTGNDLMLAVAPSRPRPGLNEPELPATTAPVVLPPAQAIASVPPAEQKSANPARETSPSVEQAAPKTQNRIAVLEVRGPTEVDTDDSLGFKLRTGGKSAPSEAQLKALGEPLREHLADRLTKSLPDKVVGQDELLDAASGKSATLIGSGTSLFAKKIAKQLGVKYWLSASIGSAEFKGHTLTGEEYEIAVSAKLIRADTGEVAWRLNNHSFSKRTFDEKRDPIDYFQDVLLDQVAAYISDKVSKAIAGE
jgi:hypothetical protein